MTDDTPTSMKAVQLNLRDELRAYRDIDEAAHAEILSKLHDYETTMKVFTARVEERDKAESGLRRKLFGLTVLFLSLLSGLVAWVAVEMRELHRDVANNTAHFKEFQAIGIEWGDAIDERAKGFRDDINELRKRLNLHIQRHHNGDKEH